MEVMSTRTHGKLHMLLAVILLVVPRLLMWSPASANVMNIIGAVLLVLSIITHYEIGIVKILPMRVHLLLDVPIGLALVAAPFVLVHLENDVQIGAGLVTLIFCGITNLISVLATWRQDPSEYGVAPENRQHLSPPIFE